MHWRAPVVLLTSFFAGVVFAVGHHLFYQSLNGTVLDQATFDQQINIGIGTAFAFLIRASLVLSVGTTFVQVLWRTLLNQELPISRIDSITKLSTSLWELLNINTLLKHPLLAFLAVVTWTLPLAAIVPPATLAVEAAQEPRSLHVIRDLPFIDFNTMTLVKTYAANPPSNDNIPPNQVRKDFHGGGSDDLTQLAFGVAFQGEISSIRPPEVNSSYVSEFFGPSLQCEQIDTSIIAGFDSKFGCQLYDSSSSDRCSFNYSYLAWVPTDSERVGLNADKSTATIDFVPNYDGSGYGLTTMGAFHGEPTSMYLATQEDKKWSLLNCSLFNTSYTVTFDYNKSKQSLTTKRELLNSLPFINQVSRTMLTDISGYPPAGTTTYLASFDAMSYQAVMESFGEIMVGGIMYAVSKEGGGSNTMATSIMRTRLRNCITTIGNEKDPQACPSLALAAEELFQNITLSLFSEKSFTVVDSSRSPATDITLSTYPNIYVYTWWRLVLSYGLAILFACITVVIGGLTLLRSGESYDNVFSTIVRATRQVELDDLIVPKDRGGQEPLPHYIGEASIHIGSGAGEDDCENTALKNTARAMSESVVTGPEAARLSEGGRPLSRLMTDLSDRESRTPSPVSSLAESERSTHRVSGSEEDLNRRP